MAEPTAPPSPSPADEAQRAPAPAPSPAPTARSLGDDWPAQATDAVVKVVDAVRDKTTGPAVNAAHALKYGIVGALLASVLGVLFLIILIHVSNVVLIQVGEWLGVTWLADPIWIVYLFYGSLFSLGGLWLWRKANKPAQA